MNMQELMASRERLQRMDRGAGIQNVYGSFADTVYEMAAFWNNDRIRTSEAFLSLTDPAPLTEEWIKKALPPTGSPAPGSRNSAEYSTAIGRLSWIGWESGLCLYFFGEGVYWRNMTRGQFRMMAMSIGLALKDDEG